MEKAFGNTELKFLSYLGIRSDDLHFFTKLNCSFVLVRGFGLAIRPIGILSYLLHIELDSNRIF